MEPSHTREANPVPALLCPSGQQPAPATTHGAVSSLILGPLLLTTLGLGAALAATVGARIALNPASGIPGVAGAYVAHVISQRGDVGKQHRAAGSLQHGSCI